MPTPARRLAAVIEPVAGSAFFAPECHAAYESLGFAPSPKERDGVAQPDISAYFTSRVAPMGRVPGEVAVAVFAVFEPSIVLAGIELGWSLTDPDTIARLRIEATVAQLERLVGSADGRVDEVAGLLTAMVHRFELAGRPLAAALVGMGPRDDGWFRLHWAADVLREYRGDCHTAAWIAAGLTAPEICLLGDPYRGLAPRTYSRSRGWSHDALDAAETSLRERGFWADSGVTADGIAFRESIEVATDAQVADHVSALGSNLDRIIAAMTAWSDPIVAGGGYPANSPLSRQPSPVIRP